MKKSASILISVTLIASGIICALFGCASTSYAKSKKWPAGIDIQSSSAVVIDYDTGVVLYEKDADTMRFPASITKIMTALLAVEKCKMSETVTFSEDAVMKNEGDTSHISRDIGEQMTMEECLYGMMLESANECAWAIGEHVAGGDINKFVKMMNKKAKDLGCKNTSFQNPNGLPDEKHLVSARDMSIIARAAFQNKDFRKIVGTGQYSIPPTNKHDVPTPLNNHHAMLHPYQTAEFVYDGCLGGKTGYTVAAGATLVTYAMRGDMTLVCVTMNASPPGQYTDTTNLLDYCFSGFNRYTVSENETMFTEKSEKSGALSAGVTLLELYKDGTVILPRDASFKDAKVSIGPIKRGKSDTAKITYTYADRTVGSAVLRFKKNTSIGYPFHNLSKAEGGTGQKYIRIDFISVLVGILILAGIVLFIKYVVLNGFELLAKRMREHREQQKMKPKYKRVRKNTK